MKLTFSQGSARREILSAARKNSPAHELMTHACFEVIETSHDLEHSLRVALSRSGVTESGFHVLSYLSQHHAGTVTPGAVASGLRMQRQQVSVVLNRLELSGLLKRRRLDHNRRHVGISISPKGRDLLRHATASCLQTIDRTLSPLPTDTILKLDHSCARLRPHPCSRSMAHEDRLST